MSFAQSLSDTCSVAASELRVFGDAPQIFVPGVLAFSEAAQAAVRSCPDAACAAIATGFHIGDTSAKYSDSVLFLAAPSTVAVCAGIGIESDRHKSG